MVPKNNNTWLSYMEELSQTKFPAGQLKIEGFDKIINVHKRAFNILHHSVPMIYLLDYTTGKYCFVSSQCREVLNFPSDKMMEGGIDFTLDHYHPADLRLFNEQIFTDRRKFLKTIPTEDHKDYIFS